MCMYFYMSVKCQVLPSWISEWILKSVKHVITLPVTESYDHIKNKCQNRAFVLQISNYTRSLKTHVSICIAYYNKQVSPTLSSKTKLALSAAEPPLRAGYSQSISSPSKPYVLRYAAEAVAKFFLSVELAASVENGALPAVQPPTASRVFRFGFCAFKLLNRPYLFKEQISTWQFFHRIKPFENLENSGYKSGREKTHT